MVGNKGYDVVNPIAISIAPKVNSLSTVKSL